MPGPKIIIKLSIAVVLCSWLHFRSTNFGQVIFAQQSREQGDVVRVYTELVQTDVMVFDKQGNFVNGLGRDNFELKIDGKPRPIDFFEQVTAGSVSEESQLAAARGVATPVINNSPITPVPLDRGRTVFFYLDDLHLALSGFTACQKMITKFIENEMGQNDEAAITSATGQIGFLQQLTDNKSVLRAALQRIKPRSYRVTDSEQPQMTEYQAFLIDRSDRDVTDYFVGETIRNYPGLSRDMAENQVRSRARMTLAQAAQITQNTLIGLEGLVRSANKYPGRKVVFFLSDGFLLDDRNSDSQAKLRRITSAAARSGVVIYSMDARGLVASLGDASTSGAFDPSGRMERATHGELLATQDGLNALARDTGGRPIFNTNALEPGLARALKETSVYYLLAWKPDREAQATGRFRRIEVRVVGKADLTVRVRRGFFDTEPANVASKAADQKAADKTPMAKLRQAMKAPYPAPELPVSLSLNYLNTPAKGFLLSASMQLPSQFVSSSPEDGKQKSVVEIAGSVFNDRGQSVGHFGERMTATALADANKERPDLVYTYQLFLPAGIYQLRVAVHDEKSGRTGSAHAWIEIPDLSSHHLALSSVLIGERPQTTLASVSTNVQPLSEQVTLSIDRYFRRNSHLRFLVYVYNAARAPADSKPDIALQTQILRDGQPVLTTALRKVNTEAVEDLDRLPYAAEILLTELPVGRYLLMITVIDRVTKTSASQHTRFEIH